MNEAHQVCGSDEWRETMRDIVFPWALGDASLGNDVLEVGPGYGAATDVLSTMTAQLTSVEIDEQLAAMLQERFAATPSVRIVRADATALDFQNGKFTGAACFTMLHHVPTTEMQDRLLSEIARVLRPGAPLVVSDSIGSEELEALHNDDTYNPIDPAAIKDRLAGAGFTQVQVRIDPPRWSAVGYAQ